MRYDDWDVLLFPSNSDERVPFKEFSVNCHVVADAESPHGRTSLGLPVMTCFVPSLQPGSPFHISIHCWGTPTISQYALTYSKFPALVKLEARIMIDGRMVASTSFDPVGDWPHLISASSVINLHGEREPLKFPSFRRELLHQNHWNPGDDLGRIKVIISEGFPRDSSSNPIERIKNVAVFSFQHAPMDILENNGIAWPNPRMWHCPQNDPVLPVPTYHPEDGADSHLHSPRHASTTACGMGSGLTSALPMSISGSFAAHPAASIMQQSSASSGSDFVDPFSEVAYQEWVNSLGLPQQMLGPDATTRNISKGSDSSSIAPDMSAFLSSNMIQNLGSDFMSFSSHGLDEYGLTQPLKVPSSTPNSLFGTNAAAVGRKGHAVARQAMSGDFSNSLTHSLLNQPYPMSVTSKHVLPQQVPLPASEVKSRKENRHVISASSVHSPSLTASPSIEAQIRKFSLPANVFGVIGTERDASGSSYTSCTSAGVFGAPITTQGTPTQSLARKTANILEVENEQATMRNSSFNPASITAIDEEDEPSRISPRSRIPTNRCKSVETPLQNDG
ncbi:hypothetical protein BD289DRAFT_484497 [Coniella lustricola]|uniref:Uncharacterized protein n=1 Tax=Coniella lustricola TaxID=2025994 RepID=A0A2T3A1S2_9PEZI|nr:hypothetical protein BD289DRAFT_484497 [Coniella lustricola]